MIAQWFHSWRPYLKKERKLPISLKYTRNLHFSLLPSVGLILHTSQTLFNLVRFAKLFSSVLVSKLLQNS